MLNDIYQAIDPVAISIGPLQIRWYGLAYIFGFFLASIVVYRVAKRWKLKFNTDDMFVFLIAVALGIILGARIFYIVFYGAGYYLEHPLAVFALNQGGMSFHGGLIGGIIGGVIATKRVVHMPILTMADLAAIGAPIGLFLGRIANFINGELWGKETDVFWAVAFESGGGVPRHPSQLYEAFLEGIVIFVILYMFSRKLPPKPQGFFSGLFLVLYGVFRILIEFVRVPDSQLGYLIGDTITMGQILSLPLVIVGVVLLVYAFYKRKPQPQVS